MEKNVLLKVNEKYNIDRYANASTGYQWKIMLSPGIDLIADDVINVSNEVGGGSTKRFTVAAKETGIYYVALMYLRTWENFDVKAEVIRFEIVRKLLNIDLILDGHDGIIGYAMNQQTYDPEGNPMMIDNIPKMLNIKVSNEDDIDHLNFYKQNGELTYSVGTCLWNPGGRKIGCYDDFDKFQHLGSIRIKGTSNKIMSKVSLTMKPDGTVTGFKVGDSNDPRDFVIQLSFPIGKDRIYLKIYKWQNKIVYQHIPNGYDMFNTVYEANGKKLGSPTGGLTGKGDGFKFTGAKFLGEVIINP